MTRLLPGVALTLLAAGCGAANTHHETTAKEPKLDVVGEWSDPEADLPVSTTTPAPGRDKAANDPTAKPIVIVHATIMTANGQTLTDASIVLDHGAITALGKDVPIPAGARTVDGSGKFVTPGIIDVHSHIGVYAVPYVNALADGNEATNPNTADVRSEYGYYAQDPAITRAAAGGITTAQILPGSANLIGGRGYVLVMKPGTSARDLHFPGAPQTLKMACGENPKRVYGEKGGPSTRMGEYAAFRAAFQAAAEYNAKLIAYKRDRALWLKKKARAAELDAVAGKDPKKHITPEAAPAPVPVDRKLETLAGVLRGEILPQIHCYRSDDIRQMVAIADEFGFHIRAFHHALEAYKVRDLLVKHGIAIATWADWWGFKMEAFDGIPENAALFQQAGGRPTIHSDDPIGIQRLNQEASKAMWAGRHAGIDITDDQALRWITANPAWVLGISDSTGTLEVGKRADVVLWSANPFSVYAAAELTIAGGHVTFDRKVGLVPTDFELGNSAIAAPAQGASR